MAMRTTAYTRVYARIHAQFECGIRARTTTQTTQNNLRMNVVYYATLNLHRNYTNGTDLLSRDRNERNKLSNVWTRLDVSRWLATSWFCSWRRRTSINRVQTNDMFQNCLRQTYTLCSPKLQNCIQQSLTDDRLCNITTYQIKSNQI